MQVKEGLSEEVAPWASPGGCVRVSGHLGTEAATDDKP